ncbi:MAG: hypothetical protein ABSC56_02855 [Solirubrobacteraceae bacterium]|jgi:hypothetical protein
MRPLKTILIRRRARTARTAGSATVELAGHEVRSAREAFVERVTRRRGCAEVSVLLADGSDATARLAAIDLDWLDVRAGDIVFVR